MDNTQAQTPTEAVVIEFPRKTLVQKSVKYVVAAGCITAGTLAWFNYKAKAEAGEYNLGTDEEELEIVEGTTE